MPAPKDPLKYEEWKKKLSLSMSGENNPNFGKPSWNRGISPSEETKRKISLSISGENNPIFGKPRSEETKRKIGLANRGRIKSKETRKKISSSNTGKKRSNETKKKMSLSKIGGNNPNFNKHPSNETRRRLSLSKIGKPRSEETKRKIGLAHRGKPKSEEHKKKLSMSQIGKIIPEKTCIKLSMFYQGIENIDDWEGYITHKPYCDIFTPEFRLRQYEVTGYKCLICGEIIDSPHCHHVYWQKSSCCQNVDGSGELFFMIRGKKFFPNILPMPHLTKEKELIYGLNKFAVLCIKCHGKIKGNKNGESYVDYIKKIENIINTEYNGRSYYTKEEYWGNGYYSTKGEIEKFYDVITGEFYGKSLRGFNKWGLPKIKPQPNILNTVTINNT